MPSSSSYLPVCVNQEQLLLSRDLRGRRGLLPTVIPVYLRMAGTLNVEALRGALQAFTERHEALRTSFHHNPALSPDEIGQSLREYARTGIVKPGLYLQRVAGEVQIELPMHTVTESALRDLVNDELTRSFDPEVPPRFRACLFQLAKDEHRLLIVLDHLVSDGWSVRLLERELHSLYVSFARSTPSALKPPGMSLPDFAEWQSRNSFDRAIHYWRGQWEQFRDTRIHVQDFPFAIASTEKPGPDFATWQATFDPAVAGDARRVAVEQRVSLFMLFLAVWAVVLRHYTGKERFPVWTHFNNRVRPETHGTFGYLINTHIIGLDLGEEPSGRQVLDRVRRAVLEATAHQELPLPQLWRAIGSAPRFDDAFVMLDIRNGNVAVNPEPDDELRITRTVLPDIVLPRLSQLGVYVTDYQSSIDVAVAYRKDAFHSDSIRLLGEHFARALSELVSACRTS